MSVKQENRWRRKLHLESQRLNDLKRQIEAASMERGPRPAAIKPVNDGARRRDVRAWMRANAHQYETATALAEAANTVFRLPGDGLDDETHWVWDEAAEAVEEA